jgi:hypothetical protein
MRPRFQLFRRPSGPRLCDRKRFVHDIAADGFAQKWRASALVVLRTATIAVACKDYKYMKNK